MSHRVCRFVSVAYQCESIATANAPSIVNDTLASAHIHKAHRSQRFTQGQNQAYFHTIALMLVLLECAG